ncbi:monovalent cation/H+ antiporter complex subunit F [Nesterenkonia flava]|uniref:Monovalent cation/H+ antiporter complex subunit F n=1 Tax=Nesterenkonia flava TaxID=469799 RepID=A0ABU1FVT1_9MICC|nr:monovalent cation/H+ antiporter complex subunit F [Nesterenkonia flava]MDR5712783.1 monovalent cation/H+ antiporter complex subunit F [Nesterenkonia flava]
MEPLQIAYWITQVLLSIGALCAVYRVYKGPSVLDRVISVDVILIIVASVMLADMAVNQHTDFIPFVVVAAMIGFLGAVAIARYVAVGSTASADAGSQVEAQERAMTAEIPEPEIPMRSFADPAAGAAPSTPGAERTGDEDESTSWFTALTKSGFVPGKKETQSKDGEQGEDSDTRRDEGDPR